MAITISVDSNRATLVADPLLADESPGVQTPVAPPADDGNEIDVTLTSETAGSLGGFATAFNTFLNSATLGLTDAQKIFARDHDGASSGTNFVQVTTTANETINDLFFSDATGQPLNGDLVAGMLTLDNLTVHLYTDGTFGSSGDFAVAATSTGRVVAAFYLNENTTDHKSAQVEMVTFEPLKHPDATDPDDALNFTDVLRVSSAGSLSFDFDTLDSGANLWVAVGSPSAGVLVSGENLDVDSETKITNASDKIHVSQGGEGTTIGLNNQLFDTQSPNETAVFTLVTGMSVLSADGGAQGVYLVDPKPQDNKPEGIDYSGYLNVTGAGIFISQSQGNDLKDFDISVYRAGGVNGTVVEDGAAYVGTEPSGAFDDDIPVNVATVTVKNALNQTIAVWSTSPTGTEVASGATVGGVTVSISGNNIDVNGVDDLYTVSWTSAGGATFNRFQLKHEAGQFDVGRIDVTQTIPGGTAVGDKLFVEDDGPTVTLALQTGAEVRIDESLGANAGETEGGTSGLGSRTVTAAVLFSTTANFGTDGANGTSPTVWSLAIASAGVDSGLDTTAGTSVLLYKVGDDVVGRTSAGGADIFKISINATSGDVTLTQYAALKHPDATDPDESTTPLSIAAGAVSAVRTVKDGDNDPASASADIGPALKFEDDGPAVTLSLQAGAEVRLDESLGANAGETEGGTSGLGSRTVTAAVLFSTTAGFGQDGENGTSPTVWSLSLSGAGADSGLDTTAGTSVLLYKVGDNVVGRTSAAGADIFKIGIDATSGAVTLTQYESLKHSDASDPDEATTPLSIASGLVSAVRTVKDGDNDTATASADIGPALKFEDDGPAIGLIADGLVNFALNASVTNTLAGAVGQDEKTGPYTLTSFTSSITVAGVELHGVASGTTQVGYWADSNNDTIFGNAGDTEYYRLALGDQAGAGNYTFTVLVPPPPSFTEFDFDALDSGANLWVGVGSPTAGLLVSGENLYVDSATKITNASDKIHVSQGGEGTTIGLNNQLFDNQSANETAVMTLVTGMNVLSGDGGAQGVYLVDPKPNDNKPEGIDYSGYMNVNSAGIFISQSQGNDLKDFDINLYRAGGVNGTVVEDGTAYLGTAPSGAFDDDIPVNAKTVSVFTPGSTTPIAVWSISPTGTEVASGATVSGVTVTISGNNIDLNGLDDLYTVSWTAVDGQTFNRFQLTREAGQFDVGKVFIFQGNDTPDQVLDFTARVTDGDGDYAEDSWKVGIDGTGIYDDGAVEGVTLVGVQP